MFDVTGTGAEEDRPGAGGMGVRDIAVRGEERGAAADLLGDGNTEVAAAEEELHARRGTALRAGVLVGEEAGRRGDVEAGLAGSRSGRDCNEQQEHREREGEMEPWGGHAADTETTRRTSA